MSTHGQEAVTARNDLRRTSLDPQTQGEVMSAEPQPTVFIVAPPWPRSGTGRVIQNQIDFYRSRGYRTWFIGVAIHQGYVRTNTNSWTSINKGIADLGADGTSIATFDRRRYVLTKYSASLRHGFYGTALDWIVDIGESAEVPNDVADHIRRSPVALLHVNHVFTMGFAQRLRKELVRTGHHVPLVLETHDVQSHVLHERGEPNPWTRRPDSVMRMIRSEKKLLEKADVLIHLSVDDFEFFKKELPSKPQILAMPSIDESFISTVDASFCGSSIDPIDLLFVGYHHRANVVGLEWFLKQVWPLIAKRKYRLKVVGPVDSLVRASLPKIYEEFQASFVGEVADLTPYYRAARCAIAPMVSGSGISIKTIEALALGKPFVGTSKAFRGMPMDQIEGIGLRAHDTPQAFADAIVKALSSQDLHAALSRAAYDRMFSRQAMFMSRDEAVRLAREAGLNGRSRSLATP